LDIEVVFQVDTSTVVEGVMEASMAYKCSTNGGAVGQGLLGPFGRLVLADEDMLEKTLVYFYIVKDMDDSLNFLLPRRSQVLLTTYYAKHYTVTIEKLS
jgi:hypothetical protein